MTALRVDRLEAAVKEAEAAGKDQFTIQADTGPLDFITLYAKYLVWWARDNRYGVIKFKHGEADNIEKE